MTGFLTCSRCNSIKQTGESCKACKAAAARYQKNYRENAKARVLARAKPVFKRLKKIKMGRIFDVHDKKSGALLLSGLFDNAQQAYEALIMRSGKHVAPDLEEYYSDYPDIRTKAFEQMPAGDSWLDDNTIYIRAAALGEP